MKFIIAVALTIVVAWIAGMFSPWWSIAAAAFVVALIVRQGKAKSWFAGFLGVFICWGVVAMAINMNNDGILTQKIAVILPLKGSVALLVLLTAFAGGLVGGMGALSAALLTGTSKK